MTCGSGCGRSGDKACDSKKEKGNNLEQFDVVIFVCSDTVDPNTFLQDTEYLNKIFLSKDFISFILNSESNKFII